MDRARLGEPDGPPTQAADGAFGVDGAFGAAGVTAAAALARAADPLADEMRHSALLLGWALGLMGTVAVLLLVLTTRFGG